MSESPQELDSKWAAFVARNANLSKSFPAASNPQPRPEAPITRPNAPVRNPQFTKPNARPNAYAGKCGSCGGWMEANAGLLGPKVEGRWTVLHKAGECVEKTPVAPKVESTFVRKTNESVDDYKFDTVRPGIYTVVDGDERRTYKVELQAPDSKFAPGATKVSYLMGRDNESDYKSFAFVKNGRLAVWKSYKVNADSIVVRLAEKLVSDPEAALEAAACLRCNKLLTVDVSIFNGYGPECAKKVGL